MLPIERDLIRRARSGKTIPTQELNEVPIDSLWKVVKNLRKAEQRNGDIFYSRVRKQRLP